jgi:hypothetical protein
MFIDVCIIKIYNHSTKSIKTSNIMNTVNLKSYLSLIIMIGLLASSLLTNNIIHRELMASLGIIIGALSSWNFSNDNNGRKQK